MSDTPLRCTVAIPARNEAALIGRCLGALARQTVDPRLFEIVVLANNCSDGTAEVARSAAYPGLLRIVERSLPPGSAHAGGARRAAFEEARGEGPILSTDADCVPDPDWVEASLDAFASGADAVAGRVSGDWEELKHLPPDMLEIGALEWEYLSLVAKAADRFDPRPHNPLPGHVQRCGANLAITAAMLRRVGGVPPIPTGEDRALFAAVERLDGQVRQDMRSHVVASARTRGRASGGMADAIAARARADYLCDPQLEPARALVRRLRLRRRARAAWACNAFDRYAAATGLTLDPAAPAFGVAWEALEATAPLLARARLTPADLPVEIATLRGLVEGATRD